MPMTTQNTRQLTRKKIMPMNKKPTPKAASKNGRNYNDRKADKNYEMADRNKMKIYGDIPDPRPRGRVYTPEMLGAEKRLRRKKGYGI